MAIDRFQLADELNALRDLASRKWKDDPLPVGRAASERLKREIEENDLHKNIAELEFRNGAYLRFVSRGLLRGTLHDDGHPSFERFAPGHSLRDHHSRSTGRISTDGMQ